MVWIYNLFFRVLTVGALALLGTTLFMFGCERKDTNAKLSYIYSNDSVIYEFCEALRISIENSPKIVNANDTALSNLIRVVSKIEVPFDYLDWEVVEASERKHAYILTLPHNETYYDRHGAVRNVSITTVQKYVDQFEEKTEGITYAKTKISGSDYIFYRRIAKPKYDASGEILHQPSADSFKRSLSSDHYNRPVYIEFQNLQYDLNAKAEMIVVFEGHIVFLNVYSANTINQASELTVRIFDKALKPGEKPFSYQHPRGQREVSGPLRHVNDNGCRYTLFNHEIHKEQEKT
jgi:hypothetical protein